MKKTHVNSNVDLNTLAGGAFAEKVNEALVQVGENIQNQNTAGEPLDLRKRGQQSPETETPEEKPEPDFDPETGEIFENGKGGKVIAMAKQA